MDRLQCSWRLHPCHTCPCQPPALIAVPCPTYFPTCPPPTPPGSPQSHWPLGPPTNPPRSLPPQGLCFCCCPCWQPPSLGSFAPTKLWLQCHLLKNTFRITPSKYHRVHTHSISSPACFAAPSDSPVCSLSDPLHQHTCSHLEGRDCVQGSVTLISNSGCHMAGTLQTLVCQWMTAQLYDLGKMMSALWASVSPSAQQH
jgi:hypothetical protein